MALTPERVNKRLSRIFIELFPDAEGRDMDTLTQDNVPGWDSLATLTVFAMAERDFGVRIALDQVASVHTFSELRTIISARLVQ